ncbi:synaptotagmin 7 [Plakobranchus ocellatus]|uniref:Synaptotagmin 7 n=1 Tax=Plakobranchus ocellatus TaxID=259542 RepID=A0AAV4D7K1_9GAST|nr:synaptotagmin 7 [Plakobranchus ocellatus]
MGNRQGKGSNNNFMRYIENRFERPDKRMVTEHVQPSPGSQTSLNQQLAMRDSSPMGYQAMGITRVSTWLSTRTGGSDSGDEDEESGS